MNGFFLRVPACFLPSIFHYAKFQMVHPSHPLRVDSTLEKPLKHDKHFILMYTTDVYPRIVLPITLGNSEHFPGERRWSGEARSLDKTCLLNALLLGYLLGDILVNFYSFSHMVLSYN